MAVTLMLAAVWVLLAWWRPTTTWHLAPALIAGIPPYLAGQWHARARRLAATVLAGLVGAVVAGAVTLGLHLAGWLAGPAMVGPTPTVEAVLSLAFGVTVGVLAGRLANR